VGVPWAGADPWVGAAIPAQGLQVVAAQGK